MVEHAALLIYPWTRFSANQGSGEWRAAIADAADGNRLGFAQYPHNRWLAWLGSAKYKVYETEDESLLMTMDRGFFPIWDVLDADDHDLGSVAKGMLLDRLRGLRARWEECFEGSSGRFLTPNGQELGQIDKSGGGAALVLQFFAPTEGDPLLRLVMLAAALTQLPRPRGL